MDFGCHSIFQDMDEKCRMRRVHFSCSIIMLCGMSQLRRVGIVREYDIIRIVDSKP